MEPEMAARIAAISTALSKLRDRPGPVFRGTPLTPEQIALYVPGTIRTEAGFSTGRRSAKRWALGAYSRNPILCLGSYADRRFRLYCTAGAEDEARRIFTPELIAALNRVERSVDVEVSGHFMFVSSTRQFRFPRPGAVTAVFSLISLVGSLARTT